AVSNFLPSGVSYCDCSYSTFGYWGYLLEDQNSRDRVHLGQFVAGISPASVPVSGTATYSGHAVADVSNPAGTSKFKAAGGFTMSYTFNPNPSNPTVNSWT